MTNSEQEQKKMSEIAKMDWEDFEKKFEATTRGTRGGAADDEEAMRKYFGDQEFKELKKLAEEARKTRQRAPALGNVVFLPGIMGSNLVTIKNGVEEGLVWVNLFKLVQGDIERLKLSDDGGREADSNYQVRTSIMDKRTYSRAILKLRVRWDVQPFAFDWRKDINTSSDELAKFIDEKFKDKPVHLVAHSMGGLVCRNFIHRHKELWERMRGDMTENQGGRLIMIGTPNYGSFAIPQVLTGVEKMVRWLSQIDLSHSLTEILEIINTFVGSYQMLPAPSKILASIPDLYRRNIWGNFPVSEKHLKRAAEFHQGLEDKATIDPRRMTYIAGCNQKTLSRLEFTSPGEFQYFTTLDGDGLVSFELGLLKDVPTYYVEESHGSLPKNDKVINAIDELLERGVTSVLPNQPIAARAILTDGGRWHRSIGEYQTGSDLETIARRAARNEADADELRTAEETLVRAMMGEDQPARNLEQMKEKKQAHATNGKRVPLHIEVVKGDVTQVSAPVVVVGHYKGVAPANAEKALDEALNFWISRAGEHSTIGAELGQLFFIPVNRKLVNRKRLAADAVLLAGMGEEGRFNRYDLRYLMMNVTYAISALEVDGFATVLIGAGAGNLKEDAAIRGMLFGICDAIHRLSDKTRLKRITLVEIDEERYQKIFETLNKIKTEDSAANLDINVTKKKLPKKAGEKEDQPERPEDLPEPEFGPRITIERDGDVFRFSALTENAVIPVRQVELQSFFPQGISNRLMMSNTKEEQETFGRLLNTSLFPEDFQQLFHTDKALTLILDRSTASFPWEMTCFGRPEGPAFFGTHLKLTRQFRTLLSLAPGIRPQVNERLKVLIIADPAPEREYQLSGARVEGLEVARVLNRIKHEGKLEIEVVDRIGAAECDPVEILALILDGMFDVVHFAGHGVFDLERPDRGGWVFGKDRFLSAREIFRARQVPRLVFANACFSSVVNKGKALTAEEMNRHLAGIAEAFFERGVQNYIGAGWPVRDDLAVKFATNFYSYALSGQLLEDSQSGESPAQDKTSQSNKQSLSPKTLGESLSEARKLIIHDGSTWGAYHHYGQANAMLMSKPKNIRSRSRVVSRPKGKIVLKPQRKNR